MLSPAKAPVPSGVHRRHAAGVRYNIRMENHEHDLKKITEYCSLVEDRISRLLEEAQSRHKLSDVKNYIFNAAHTAKPREWIGPLLGFFDRSMDDIDDDDIDVFLAVIQDAWNYFPHRSLNGECPAELFSRATAADVTLSQLPDMEDVDFDADKIDDAVLALLLLGLHADARVWKGHDWTALDHLFQKGYITDPARKAKSVMLTDLGLAEAQRLFKELFAR